MKLIVAFDNVFDFSDEDIIISDTKPIGVHDQNFIKVGLNNKDYVSQIDVFTKTYFAKKKKSNTLENATKASINNFYSNWVLVMFAWVDTVLKVVEKHRNAKLVIIGYTKNIGYIPYYEAEGEIGKKLLYKTKDVLPSIICNVLSKKKIDYEIVNKQNVIKLMLRIFVRRYGLLTYKLFFFAYKTLKAKNFSTTNKFKFLFFSRAISHTEYVERFVKIFNKETLLHVSNSITSKSANSNYVSSQNIDNSIYDIQYTRLSHVLMSFILISKSIFEVLLSKRVYLNINDISINFSSVQLEMLISYFDALIYKKSIEDIEINPDVKFITSEMYSPHAYVIAAVAKKRNVVSMQLQSFAMFQRREPSFFYSDYFLTNNEQNALFLKSIYPKQADKINFIGNLSVVEKNNTNSIDNTNLKKIVYFSQPTHNENKEEFLLVNKLLELQKTYKYELYIKLHPREEQSKYSAFSGLKFIKKGLTFSHYINDVDLAIIRTTSVGQQLIINNTPTLFCLLTETARSAKIDYIDHAFFGTIYHTKDIENKIIDFKVLVEHFHLFRKNYLKKNHLDKGVFSFYNKAKHL